MGTPHVEEELRVLLRAVTSPRVSTDGVRTPAVLKTTELDIDNDQLFGQLTGPDESGELPADETAAVADIATEEVDASALMGWFREGLSDGAVLDDGDAATVSAADAAEDVIYPNEQEKADDADFEGVAWENVVELLSDFETSASTRKRKIIPEDVGDDNIFSSKVSRCDLNASGVDYIPADTTLLDDSFEL